MWKGKIGCKKREKDVKKIFEEMSGVSISKGEQGKNNEGKVFYFREFQLQKVGKQF